MLATLRAATACRLVAALLAVAGSGALRAAADLAPARPHRCACRHGPEERCTCPACGERARRARRDAARDAPPCHRLAAERALAAEQERAQRDRDLPCLQGDCGSKDPAAPPRGSVESFTLPDPPLVRGAAPTAARTAPAAAHGTGAPAPEPPPPRAA